MLWYLIMALIVISLLVNNKEYIFLCLFSSHLSSSVKYFMSFVHVLIAFFINCFLYCWALTVLYIFQIVIHCLICDLQILSITLQFIFYAFNRVFHKANFKILITLYLSVFSFVRICVFDVRSKNTGLPC